MQCYFEPKNMGSMPMQIWFKSQGANISFLNFMSKMFFFYFTLTIANLFT